MKSKILTLSLLLLAGIQLSACSQQQVINSTVAVAKLPVKAAGAAAGAAGFLNIRLIDLIVYFIKQRGHKHG